MLGRTVQVAAAALAIASLARCAGDPPAPVGPAREDEPVEEVRVDATPLPFTETPPPALGTGWDAIAEEPREACLRARAPLVERQSTGWLGSPSSGAETRALLGLGGFESNRARLALTGDDPLASLGRSLLDGRFVTQSATVLDLTMDAHFLGPNAEWLVDPAASDFAERCGDVALEARATGGVVLVLWTIEHASETWKSAVQEALRTGGAWASDPDVRRRLAPFAGHGAMRVVAVQRGGDPTLLSTRVGDGSTAAAWQLDCALDALGPCAAFLDGAIQALAAQGPGTFAATVASLPIERQVRRLDWRTFGGSVSPRYAPAALGPPRFAVILEVERQLALRHRLEVLRSDRLLVAAPVASRLPGWEAAVASNLALLAEAGKDCWERITDPADGAQLARCAASADPATLATRGLDDALTLDQLVAE
jgi:hypothetical protein